jgi:DNA-binding transcriptional ArsR family regulator
MPAGHPRRSRIEGAALREVIRQRYTQGETQWKIGMDLGITQQAVSVHLEAIHAAWLASAIQDFDARKAQELAKTDLVELTFWQGWERSCQDKEVRITKPKRGTSPKDVSVRLEPQAGNPVFLDGVLRCIERRCKLLGLDAATRYKVNWDELSDRQLARLTEGDDPNRVLAEA